MEQDFHPAGAHALTPGYEWADYRVLRLLMGGDEQQVSLPDHPIILVAADLSPSDTASLDRGKSLGFCTAASGPTGPPRRTSR